MLSAATQEKIQDLVRKSLPETVSGELADVLKKAASIEDAYKVASEELKAKHAFIQKQEKELLNLRVACAKLDSRWVEYNNQAQILNLHERELELREGLIELREKHAKDKVSGMHDVVVAVFGNNRYKYERTTTAPVVMPAAPGIPNNEHGYGSVPPMRPFIEDRTTTETGEGES